MWNVSLEAKATSCLLIISRPVSQVPSRRTSLLLSKILLEHHSWCTESWSTAIIRVQKTRKKKSDTREKLIEITESVYPFLYVFIIHWERSISAACPWMSLGTSLQLDIFKWFPWSLSLFPQYFNFPGLFPQYFNQMHPIQWSKAVPTTSCMSQHMATSPLCFSCSAWQLSSVPLRPPGPKGHPAFSSCPPTSTSYTIRTVRPSKETPEGKINQDTAKWIRSP